MLTITVKSRKDLKEQLEQNKYYEMIFVYFVELIKYGTAITVFDCYKEIVFEINEKNVLKSSNTKEPLKTEIIKYIGEIFIKSNLYVHQEKIINIKKNNNRQHDGDNKKDLTISDLLPYLHAQNYCDIYNESRLRITQTTFKINDLKKHELYDVIKNCAVKEIRVISYNKVRIILKGKFYSW